MSLPNLISLLRICAAPVLLGLAWRGYSRAALILLMASFASDVLDGYLARRLGQSTPFGAHLDSVGDFTLYVTILLVGWRLWPDIMWREAPYFITVTASIILPAAFGYAKFRTATSYHTWAAKLAALLIGGSVIFLFAGGSPWFFRLATPVSVYAGLEEIAITLVLSKSHSNVRSFWRLVGRRAKKTD